MDEQLQGSNGNLVRCEKCGATEISLNIEKGVLQCHFCRHEQAPQKFEKAVTNIRELEGVVIGSGASEIPASTEDVLTFKCGGCASEVIVDTTDSTYARCHWCRHTLSIDDTVANGAVPDKVLPFTTKKEDAEKEIYKFLKARSFYAHPRFKNECTSSNMMGVYLPYMVVDARLKGQFSGQGEIELRRWTETRTVGTGKNRRRVSTTYYDADCYEINRNFDMLVENLTIESNAQKLSYSDSNATNNIINAVKPFKLDETVAWHPSYMKGYTSQKRDVNVSDLADLVNLKMSDIARRGLRPSISQYGRGVQWQRENLDVVGKQWKAAYFPVWIYSYQHTNKKIHYVAVNGQTLKTMGSVPIHTSKLLGFSAIVGLILGLLVAFGIDHITEDINFFVVALVSWLFIAIVYFATIQGRYRNKGARHTHEDHPYSELESIQSNDRIIRQIRRTTRAHMAGDNQHEVKYRGN